MMSGKKTFLKNDEGGEQSTLYDFNPVKSCELFTYDIKSTASKFFHGIT